MLIDSPDLPLISDMAKRLAKCSMEEALSLDAIASDLAEILRSREPQRFLKNEIKRMAEDPLHVTLGDLNLVEVFAVERMGMYIYSLTPEQTHRNDVIWSTPNSYLCAVLTPRSEITVERYRYSSGWNVNVYDESARLIPVSSERISEGDICHVTCDAQAVRILVDKPVALLKLLDMRGNDYQWMFDGKTLAPKLICAAMPRQSRVDMLIDVASAFHGSGYVGDGIVTLFEKLSSHPMHHIRWKAIQALYRVSKEKGLGVLEKAVNDENPHVAQAAASALMKLGRAATSEPHAKQIEAA